MNDATCDGCNNGILNGQGYAVYSEATQGIATDHRVFFSAPGLGGTEKGDTEIKPLDAMLYCEECANALFTKKVWQDAKALRVEMDLEDANSAEGKEARSEVINFSIALRAKRWGIIPWQARREARALGKLWWKDQNKAKRRLIAQDPPATIGS